MPPRNSSSNNNTNRRSNNSKADESLSSDATAPAASAAAAAASSSTDGAGPQSSGAAQPPASSTTFAPAAAASSASEQPQQQQQQSKQQQQQQRLKNLVVIPPPLPRKSDEAEPRECSLCSNPIEAYGVFDCGHFACYKCALRIRRTFRRSYSSSSNNNNTNRRGGGGGGGGVSVTDNTSAAANNDNNSASKGPCKCHICRNVITQLIVTDVVPADADSMQYDKNELVRLNSLSSGGNGAKRFHALNCSVTNDRCALLLLALISFVCPFDKCWHRDEETGGKAQEAFNNLDGLQRHLRVEHGGSKYCEVCVQQGYSFLCELPVYSPAELAQHQCGTNTSKDLSAFGGHPQCLFCHAKVLYDGDSMLEHLKMVHYVCDFCNIGHYKFVYYNDREALNRHWRVEHKLCTHPECAQLDESERVFASELELAQHMMKKHNVKQKVSLTQFGFTSGASEISVPGRGGGGAAAAAAAASSAVEARLAEQAAAHQTTLITYDFVGRTQVVPLIPKIAHQPASQQDHGNSNSRRNAPGRRQPVKANGAAAPSSGENAAGAAAAAAAGSSSSDSNGNNKSSTTTPVSDAAEEADGVLRRIVFEKLKKEEAKEFQSATVQYLKGQIKAIDYFGALQKLFPDEETLDTVHSCLVETLKARKNNDLAPAASSSSGGGGGDNSSGALLDALVAAKALVLSVEAQRVKAAKEEEERQQKQAEVRKAHKDALRGKVITHKMTNGNAWHQRSSENTAPATILSSGSGGGSSAAAAKPAPKRWGPNSAASSTGLAMNTDVWADHEQQQQQQQQPHHHQPAPSQSSSSRPHSQAQTPPIRSPAAAAAAVASAPSLGEVFPGLSTTTRRGDPHPNQAPKPKGVWKNNRLLG